jgi:regulator of nucleoside diphosphate kinase
LTADAKSTDSIIGLDMSERLPPIIVERRDHARLQRLAVDALREGHPVGRFLISEVRRAVVCDMDKMPDGVARLNKWATYRIDRNKRTESKILVCPEEFMSAEVTLSVLSPLGAAVLGMSVGNSMKFFSSEGGLHFVIVESVVAPPGAPLLFPLKARRAATRVPIDSRGPDDEGPSAA